MAAVLLGAGIPVVYVAGWLACARHLFGRWRPSTEVVRCRYPDTCRYSGSHDSECYKRGGLMAPDSSGEAVMFAMLAGLAWPLAWMPLLVMWRPRPLEGEMAARIRRLERELGVGEKR